MDILCNSKTLHGFLTLGYEVWHFMQLDSLLRMVC